MSVLVLGTFDGVHIAHRRLISVAKSTGEKVIACTFDSPFLKSAKLLTTIEEKTVLLKECGTDQVHAESFDFIKELSPEEYIKGLCQKFSPVKIITGFNHRFGKNAEGTPATLSYLGKKYGFIPVTVPPIRENDILVSSTAIRALLQEGKIEAANRLLSRYYSLSGNTVHGRRLGTQIGFPTINTDVDKAKLIPQKGVYATFVKTESKIYKGMTNIGTNPTVTNENILSVETHILGFNEDIYGKAAEILFVKKVREDKKFSSLDALKNQLSDDALLINAYLDTVK